MRGVKVALVSWLLGLSFGLASDAAAPEEFATNSVTSVHEATNYLGVWIWDKETHDKQTCRFWKRFEIPKGTRSYMPSFASPPTMPLLCFWTAANWEKAATGARSACMI